MSMNAKQQGILAILHFPNGFCKAAITTSKMNTKIEVSKVFYTLNIVRHI